jgi:hypothetical protein
MKKEDLILISGLLGVVMLYLFLVTFRTIPPTGIENAKTIVPFLLGSVLGTVVGWKYGTSKSSEDKNKTIADIAANGGPKVPTPPPVAPK